MNKWINGWIKNIGDFKFLTGMYFMGTVIVYMIVAYFMGETSILFTTLWQIILTSVLGAGLQELFFGTQILSEINPKIRMGIHFVVIYVSLLALSQIFGWFALTNIRLIVILTGIYSFFYIAIFWSFYIYYKAEGNRYKKKLDAFKVKNKL